MNSNSASSDLASYQSRFFALNENIIGYLNANLGITGIDLGSGSIEDWVAPDTLNLPNQVVAHRNSATHIRQAQLIGFPWPTAQDAFLLYDLDNRSYELINGLPNQTVSWLWSNDNSIAATLAVDELGIYTLNIIQSESEPIDVKFETEVRFLDYNSFTRENFPEFIYLLERSFVGAPRLVSIEVGTGIKTYLGPESANLISVQINLLTGEPLWALTEEFINESHFSNLTSRNSVQMASERSVHFYSDGGQQLYNSLGGTNENYIEILDMHNNNNILYNNYDIMADNLIKKSLFTEVNGNYLISNFCQYGYKTEEIIKEEFLLTSTGNIEIPVRTFTPISGEIRGWVVHIHGGPRARAQTEAGLVYNNLIKTDLGIINLDYRGSSGYGQYFIELGNNEYDEGMIEDVITIIYFLRSKSELPILLMGESFGGYLALLTASRDERVDGVIAIAPITDLTDETQVYGQRLSIGGSYYNE